MIHAISVSGLCLSLSPDRLVQDNDPLGIVSRRFPVEHAHFLYAAQRLLFGEGEPGSHILHPIPAIPEMFPLAADELGGKRLAGRQTNCAARL